MMNDTFKAMVVYENEDQAFTRRLEDRRTTDLPAGEVLVAVHYSSLNYKDALSATGHKGVTRTYPHTPGIDAAGIVAASQVDSVRPGDAVIVTGFDLGMNTSGGFGGYIRVPAAWLVPLPDGLSLQESMIYGTAGFTAALSVLKLEQAGITPDQGEILVTGATGGVGCIAVAILTQAGYQVVAATGKSKAQSFLTALGANAVVHRDEISDESNRPLLKGRWAGVVDTVGGNILATAIRSTQYSGVVTCCGMVASPQLSTTVFPFILRGVSLLGIDSVNCASSTRLELWQRIASRWKLPQLATIASLRPLEALDQEIDIILRGEQVGRIVVGLEAG